MKTCALILLSIFPLFATAQQNQAPQFRDYRVSSTYAGKHAKVVLPTSDETAFRTRLQEASKQPANFAGEYVLTTWGCGTSCLHGAVVSLKTGRVVFLPGTVCCWEGEGERLVFRTNSRLLVAAGVINEESEHGAHFYELTGNEFKHLKTIPVAKISRSPTPSASVAASFDCSKAASLAEMTISNDPELSKLDDELNGIYEHAKTKAIEQDAFEAQARAAWKWREANCHSRECLITWYAQRKEILLKVADSGGDMTNEAALYVAHCRAAINFSGLEELTPTVALNIGFCFGLMDGIRGADVYLKQAKSEMAFCEPSGFKNDDLAKVFVAAVDKNPQLKELRGSLAALVALAMAYPCENTK